MSIRYVMKNEIKITHAIVLRGEVLAIQSFIERLELLLDKCPNVTMIHSQSSASKLWIKEGGESDE
jgi:hypothetical protein